MRKIRFISSIFVLVLSVVLAPALINGAALAQCTWMEGLTIVRVFNNVSDYKWLRPWNPCLDADWMAHYCCLCEVSCPSGEQTVSGANDANRAGRPGVGAAIRSDTCPSAYDIDCYSNGCPPVKYCLGPDGCGCVPGPGCCGSDVDWFPVGNP